MSPHSDSVFLDHQSSTPMLPEVFEAMKPYMTEFFGSASSQHRHGIRARDAIDKARQQVSEFLHAESPDDIIFTSGATESANLAVIGTAYANRQHGNHLVVTATEHPSVLNSIAFLETQGFRCSRIPCDKEGIIDPNDVAKVITDQTVLVCIHHTNHEIGTIQAVEEISRITQARSIPFFCDAVASGGWLPLDVQKLGIQLLSLSPHRFYGPKGVGVLYRSRRARIESIIHGGKQEGGKRAGTENVPAIVGAGMACEIAQREIDQRILHTQKLQKKLIDGLGQRISLSRLNGPPAGPKRLSTNINLSIEFIEGESLLLLCDLQGIALASGPSCVTQNMKISHVLQAIGLNEALTRGNILMTLGKDNTAEEIDFALETLPVLVERLRSMSPSWEKHKAGKGRS